MHQLPAQYTNINLLNGFLYTHLIGASSPVRDVKAIREHMAEMDASLDSMIQTFFFKKGSDGWYYYNDTPVFFLDAPDAYGKLFQLRDLCWKIQSQQNLDRELDGWMTVLLDAVESRIHMLPRYWRDF